MTAASSTQDALTRPEMGYEQAASPSRRLLGLMLAVAFHAVLIAALASGLATDIVQKVQRTVSVAIIPEVKPPPPELEPEPEPQDEPLPKATKLKVRKTAAYVPPVETAVKPQAAAAEGAISSVTTSEPTAPVLEPGPRAGASSSIRRARLRPGCEPPQYPRRSLEKGEEGALEFRFLIGSDGRVKESKLVKSSGFERLDDAARKAFEKCSFVPVTVNGVTKPTWVRQPFEWRLR